MSVQVLEITINNHKSIRNSFRRSINTYVNIDVSTNTGHSIGNSISINTNMNIMTRIRRYACFHISLVYMKNTNTLMHECVKKACVFQYSGMYIYVHE